MNKIELSKVKRGILIGLAVLFIVITGCIINYNTRAKAAEYDDIGKYETHVNGISKVGIKIILDGNVVGYCFDTWKKNDKGEYVSSTDGYGSDRRYIDGYSYSTPSSRFRINTIIKNILPEECTVTLSKYQMGKCISRKTEGTYDNGENLLKESLLEYKYNNSKSEIIMGVYKPNELSYIYDIRTVKYIGKSGGVTAKTEYGNVTKCGKAFYNGEVDKYVIKQLPEIGNTKCKGCTLIFDGWCTSQKGYEEKVVAGDLIDLDTVLYVKWRTVPNKYKVTFIDKAVGNDTEEILSTHYENLSYGQSVGAAEYMGSDTGADVYYEGRSYSGKEDRIIVSDEEEKNIVCRYFKNASYNINIKDVVKCGPAEGTTLGESTIEGEYTQRISAAEAGNDTEAGAYYNGYRYTDCTEMVIPIGGGTVYRYFTPVVYTIDYDGNGAVSGEMNYDTEYYFGSPYILPVNNYKKESKVILNKNAADAVLDVSELKVTYEFLGWSKEKDGDVVYKDGDFFSDLTNEDKAVKLYAQWKTQDISIKDVPVRKGYTFAGWSEKSDAVSGKTEFKVEDNKELYAVWQPDMVDYTVQILKAGTDGSYNMSESKIYKGIADSCIKISDLMLSKDLFKGYYLNEDKADKNVRIKSDGTTIFRVYYDRCSYTVKYAGFINGNETIIASQGAIGGSSYEVPVSFGNIKNPKRYIDEKGKIYNPGDKVVVDSDMKLYPQFLLSYNDKIYPDTYVNYGAGIKLQNYKKTGYDFEGWYSDSALKNHIGKALAVVNNICSNITLFPKFSDPLKYNITYNLKDSGVVILTGDVSSYKYMEKVILPIESQMIIPNGWKFVGWTYEGSDELITEIKAGEYGDKKVRIIVRKKDESDKDAENKNTSSDKNTSSGKDTSSGKNTSSGKDTSSDKNSSTGKNNSTAGDKKNNSYTKGDKNDKGFSKNDGSSSGVNNSNGDKKGSGRSNTNNKKSSGKGSVKKNDIVVIKNIKYAITKCKGSKREVMVTGTKKAGNSIVIPSTITIKGKKYKVTSIKSNAFSKCRSVKNVTIGNNVITIGKCAFYKSSNVKNIVIKSKIVKNIGKNAFSGLNSKCVIKINSKSKSLKKVYKNILTNKKIKVKMYK